ncbi:hypothetical protein DFH08DRAFT_940258 [Mycena albidolilacea]|uniref:Uncharacterized protein n=1 Tax=Mycena albidolilacea TaxID=1033008 RepID=A0AAD7EK86_9AGAR|nr:hypothetical protein DFH08DRAFT_940258 [Mycena albidolilacea]
MLMVVEGRKFPRTRRVGILFDTSIVFLFEFQNAKEDGEMKVRARRQSAERFSGRLIDGVHHVGGGEAGPERLGRVQTTDAESRARRQGGSGGHGTGVGGLAGAQI